MKKTLLFLLIFILSCRIALPQNDGSGEVSFYPHYMTTFDRSFYAAGINLTFFIGERWGLEYNFSIGATSDRKFYAHSPFGAAAGVWLLANIADGDGDFWGVLGIILILVPEGISYAIPLPENSALKFKVNPLGFDYLKKNAEEEIHFSGEASIKYKINISGNTFFAIEAGIRDFYDSNIWLMDAKIHFGFNLSD